MLWPRLPKRLGWPVLATLLNGFGSVLPQLAGLFVLSGSEYGAFSVAYLAFAFSASTLNSLLCDPWVMKGGEWLGEAGYRQVLALLCAAYGLVAGLGCALLLREALFAVLAAAAVLASTYRLGIRYQQVHLRWWGRVAGADGALVGAGLLTLTISQVLDVPPMLSVVLTWLVGSLAAVGVGGGLAWPGMRATRRWFAVEGSQIRRLLADSLFMDLSAIGTPYALLGVMGIAEFGIYRAVSNVSAPVRVILAPLRPVIVGGTRRPHSVQIVVGVVTLVGTVSMATWAALTVAADAQLVHGVLADLARFALPTAIYVGATVLLSIFPILCRAGGDGRRLAAGRSLQTLLGVALPVAGFIVAGLLGAVWGVALGSLVSGLIWWGLASLKVRATAVV